jgi:hypothetical protein
MTMRRKYSHSWYTSMVSRSDTCVFVFMIHSI